MNMKEFLMKLGADQALAEKLKSAADPDAAYAIAKEAGLTESYETFIDTMKKLNDAAGEMNAADVETITGGSSISEEVTVTVFLSVSAVVTCSATNATV